MSGERAGSDDGRPATPEWYGQHGEDRILADVLGKQAGLFVEVGAADGVVGSNTLAFEQLGWTGVLVEADPTPDWRILLHMHRYGYAYTRTTGVNDWFERDVAQSGWEMALAAAPHYRQNVRPMIRAALERLRLLSLAERVHGALRRSP